MLPRPEGSDGHHPRRSCLYHSGAESEDLGREPGVCSGIAKYVAPPDADSPKGAIRHNAVILIAQVTNEYRQRLPRTADQAREEIRSAACAYAGCL